MAKSPLVRGLYTLAGLLLVAVGIVGYFVPVMPGTIFLILSLGCFRVGSPRLERWLLANRFVGPTLRDWDETRSIRLRTKVIAISFIWLMILGSVVRVENGWIQGGLVLFAAWLTWYLASRKTKVDGGGEIPVEPIREPVAVVSHRV